MDVLSDVLKSVRLEGACFLNAEFTAPWCMRARYGQASVRERLGGADHVLCFHFLTEGRCKARLAEGGEVIELAEGDLVLFSNDDRHLMGSDLHVAPLESERIPEEDVAPAADYAELTQLRHGGGGDVTRFVCGYLACNRSLFRPLLDALPRIVRIHVGDSDAAALLRQLLRMGLRESGAVSPGGESTLAKVAELLFVEAIRRHAASLPAETKGLLAGMRDPQVGQALALMHASPSHPWTVEELASRIALSRSAFAERFVTLVGEPTMQYLKRWRLALAARDLRAGHDAIVRIAERHGYESEAAFNRAFKKEFGVPPAAWRRAVVA